MLTEESIAEHLEWARQQVCLPIDPGCHALPYTPAQANATMRADGWIKIGWITADHGRLAWDAWYNEGTGEGRLRQTSGQAVRTGGG